MYSIHISKVKVSSEHLKKRNIKSTLSSMAKIELSFIKAETKLKLSKGKQNLAFLYQTSLMMK